METLEHELAALRARAETLRSRHAAAEAACVDAEAKLQQHLLEADLDADEKVRAKLEAAVASCSLTRDNFAKALIVQQAKVAEAEQRLATERATVERKEASRKLSADLDAVAATLPVYLDAARAFTTALDELHHHFEATQMSAFVTNGLTQVEIAAAFTLSELRATVRAVADGSAPIPAAKPVEAPVAVAEPAHKRTLFATHSLKWTENGRVRTAPAFDDIDLPLELAERALQRRAAVGLDHELRKTHKGIKGGHVPDPRSLGVIDLDVPDYSGARHASFDPVAQANITPFDRGPERKISIPAQRAG